MVDHPTVGPGNMEHGNGAVLPILLIHALETCFHYLPRGDVIAVSVSTGLLYIKQNGLNCINCRKQRLHFTDKMSSVVYLRDQVGWREGRGGGGELLPHI